MTARIMGLDPSLTQSGVALIDLTADDTEVDLTTVKSASLGDSWGARNDRLNGIAEAIGELAGSCNLVVMEGPSFGSKGKAVWDLTGNWWRIYNSLTNQGCAILVVSPSERCKFATGKGNASKDQVLAAMVRRYEDPKLDNNNVADALVFAEIGYALDQEVGLLPLTAYQQTVVDKLRPQFTALPNLAYVR